MPTPQTSGMKRISARSPRHARRAGRGEQEQRADVDADDEEDPARRAQQRHAPHAIEVADDRRLADVIVDHGEEVRRRADQIQILVRHVAAEAAEHRRHGERVGAAVEHQHERRHGDEGDDRRVVQGVDELVTIGGVEDPAERDRGDEVGRDGSWRSRRRCGGRRPSRTSSNCSRRSTLRRAGAAEELAAAGGVGAERRDRRARRRRRRRDRRRRARVRAASAW